MKKTYQTVIALAQESNQITVQKRPFHHFCQFRQGLATKIKLQNNPTFGQQREIFFRVHCPCSPQYFTWMFSGFSGSGTGFSRSRPSGRDPRVKTDPTQLYPHMGYLLSMRNYCNTRKIKVKGLFIYEQFVFLFPGDM